MNKKTQNLLILFASLFITFQLNAQDKNSDLQDITIHLLSGNTINYKLLEIKEDASWLSKKNKRDVGSLNLSNADILFTVHLL